MVRDPPCRHHRSRQSNSEYDRRERVGAQCASHVASEEIDDASGESTRRTANTRHVTDQADVRQRPTENHQRGSAAAWLDDPRCNGYGDSADDNPDVAAIVGWVIANNRGDVSRGEEDASDMDGQPDDPKPPEYSPPDSADPNEGRPPPPPAPPPPMGVNVAQRPAEERRAVLAQQLQQAATRGLRVQSNTDYQAVLIEGKAVNHTLHAILTIFTCLIWGIVWAVLAITGGEKRHQLVVDEFGNVHWQALGKV